MGNWTITIHGTGAHHNRKPAVDADLAAVELVQKLQAMGQTVSAATFTWGNREDLLEKAKPHLPERRPDESWLLAFINGHVNWVPAKISYEFIAQYTTGHGTHPTITYSYAKGDKPEGILRPGESIEVQDSETIISSCLTNNA